VKVPSFVLFLTLVLGIYGGINFYIWRRAWQVLSRLGVPAWFFVVLALFLTLAFPIGRMAERANHHLVGASLLPIGAFFLAFLVYAFLLILIIDFSRLTHRLVSFLPQSITRDLHRAGQGALFGVVSLSLLIVVAGFINARHLRIRRLHLTVDKSAGSLRSLDIALASDIHMGILVRPSRMKKIVDRINSLEPDPILFAGDELRLCGSAATLSPTDINRGTKGWTDMHAGFYARYPGATLSGKVNPIKMSLEGGAALLFYLNPRVAHGIGASYVQGKRYSELIINGPSDEVKMQIITSPNTRGSGKSMAKIGHSTIPLRPRAWASTAASALKSCSRTISLFCWRAQVGMRKSSPSRGPENM